MTRYVLNDANFAQHNDLGDKCEGLKPQRKRPCELPGGPSSSNDECAHSGGRQQCQKMRAGISEGVISGTKRFSESHEVDYENCASNEK